MLDHDQIQKFEEGIKLFNQKEFFEAHEFFEELWQTADDETQREQFLFLVRLAAAGVHLKNANYSSLFLFGLAQKQLSEGGLEIDFLDLDNLKINLASAIQRLETSSRSELTKIAKNLDLFILRKS